MSFPKKHHYVPQYFLRSWLSEKSLLCYRVTEDRVFSCSIKDTAAKNYLYMFKQEEIESKFITPYIDEPLHKSVIKALNNNWADLDQLTKTEFFKFLILLDARNPEALLQISKAFENIRPTINLSELDKNLAYLVQDKYFGFLCIAIHELGINLVDIKTPDSKFNDQLCYIQNKIIELDILGKLDSSYLSRLHNNGTKILEVNTEQDKLITSTVPVRRYGTYDKIFAVIFSISPKKCLIISNHNSFMTLISNLNIEEKIKFINSVHFDSNFSYKPKTIILPSKLNIEELKSGLSKFEITPK